MRDHNPTAFTFIAATNIEPIDARLSRLKAEIQRIESPAHYDEKYYPGEIKAVKAAIRKVEGERDNGTTFYYEEPGTSVSRPAKDGNNLYVFAPDGRILRLPNGKLPEPKRGEPSLSMHNINPWAKEGPI